ncbi:MAG: hypothetical protein V1859_03695 [archaeon]
MHCGKLIEDGSYVINQESGELDKNYLSKLEDVNCGDIVVILMNGRLPNVKVMDYIAKKCVKEDKNMTLVGMKLLGSKFDDYLKAHISEPGFDRINIVKLGHLNVDSFFMKLCIGLAYGGKAYIPIVYGEGMDFVIENHTEGYAGVDVLCEDEKYRQLGYVKAIDLSRMGNLYDCTTKLYKRMGI